jgi:uncharacterized glyoxalase superfamily protein PhnB
MAGFARLSLVYESAAERGSHLRRRWRRAAASRCRWTKTFWAETFGMLVDQFGTPGWWAAACTARDTCHDSRRPAVGCAHRRNEM